MQWMSGHEANAQLPTAWSQEGDVLHCLVCRRDLAAEAAMEGLPEETPLAERVQLKAYARVEFEISRDPERRDGEIAKSCRTTAASVRRGRERLGIADAEAQA